MLSPILQSMPPFPARHTGMKVQWESRRKNVYFPPGIATIAALPTNHLTAPPNPWCTSLCLRRNKWELCLSRNWWWNWWDPEETDVWKPCILACYIMLMSSAEMKGSLPVHAIQLLCSAFFPSLCWFCSKLSLPFVGPSCCLLGGCTWISCLLCSRV